MTVNEKLEQWAAGKIGRDFPDDICLLLDHKTLRLDMDRESGRIGLESYVPRTSRSNALAKTFIIDGIGYDLFPQTWERLEKMAEIDHYNLTCLADADVIWARSEADRQRFESLKAKFFANLKNPHLMLERAKNWFNAAAELFADMFFENKICIVRQNAGYICDFLSNAVAYTNGMYFRCGQSGQREELRKMENVPDNFIGLYEKVIFAKDPDEQKKCCHSLLCTVKEYLNSQNHDPPQKKSRAAELAGWYHELSYTWRRVRHFCGTGDTASAYLWGCMLQKELGEITHEYDIPFFDILSAFDAGNLNAFTANTDKAEQAIISAIKADDGRLDVYRTVDEFLEKNL